MNKVMKNLFLMCVALGSLTSLFGSQQAPLKRASQYAQKQMFHKKAPHHIPSFSAAAVAAAQPKPTQPEMMASYDVEPSVAIQPGISLKLINVVFDVGGVKIGSAHCIIRTERFNILKVSQANQQKFVAKLSKPPKLIPLNDFKVIHETKKNVSVQIQYFKKHKDMVPQMRKNAAAFLANYHCAAKDIKFHVLQIS